MKNSSELLYLAIKERYNTDFYGHQFVGNEVSFPTFYLENTTLHRGGVYLCKTENLPSSCPEECIFLCTGEKPTVNFDSWQGSVLHITEKDMNIYSLFNSIIGLYDKFVAWENEMKHLVMNNSKVADIVSASLSIFENCISVIDYNLRLLADSKKIISEGKPLAVSRRDFDFLPEGIDENFTNKYDEHIRSKKPYFFSGHSNPEGKNYCVNIFSGGKYILTCILRDEIRPFYESDYILFQQFTEYVALAIKPAAAESNSGIITIKNMLLNVLNENPIKESDSNILSKNLLLNVHKTSWCCAVITQMNADVTFPESYTCNIIEKLVPKSSAVGYDSKIVCLCMVDGKSDSKIGNILRPYLEKSKNHMAISAVFSDISVAKQYYKQASQLLVTGYKYSPDKTVYTLDESMLQYMLHNCSGDFSTDMVLSDGLKSLRNLDSNVDYWNTLKVYLDNECNASKTANELFIHRSTLLTRLEKIQSLVDLDTPEKRLYVRMCMSICG